MRFLLFDRVTELEPGKRITGLKCITLADDAFREHFPRRPIFPGSLVIEAMVQLLAWTAISGNDYTHSAVLAGLEDAVVPTDLRPGTVLQLEGTLAMCNRRGSTGSARATVDGVEVASIGRVLYGHVPADDPAELQARFRYFGGPV